MNEVPPIDSDTRMKGLQRALDVRCQRAALKNLIRAGDVSPVLALDMDAAQGIKVRDLLRAVPGIGEAKAGKIMQEVGISESRRVRGLGCRQKAALTEKLEALQ